MLEYRADLVAIENSEPDVLTKEMHASANFLSDRELD